MWPIRLRPWLVVVLLLLLEAAGALPLCALPL